MEYEVLTLQSVFYDSELVLQISEPQLTVTPG